MAITWDTCGVLVANLLSDELVGSGVADGSYSLRKNLHCHCLLLVGGLVHTCKPSLAKDVLWPTEDWYRIITETHQHTDTCVGVSQHHKVGCACHCLSH